MDFKCLPYGSLLWSSLICKFHGGLAAFSFIFVLFNGLRRAVTGKTRLTVQRGDYAAIL